MPLMRLAGRMDRLGTETAFADRALEGSGVSTLGGLAFGAHGRDHVRMSYANSQPRIAEALARLRTMVAAVRA